MLYRAADALDTNGGARELADALYADLYGLRSTGPDRQSLLLSFSGRSSLASWLRAVLCQRYVDRLRADRRLEPLPADDPVSLRAPADPNRSRYLDAGHRRRSAAPSNSWPAETACGWRITTCRS